ncbi:D-TA family PLP-dependent enzyme [Cytophagaceae bacterium DM2B3-1]|uniref:D-TA family PLP-dependent enzyme n=1 Tax=Xanthocytophaga flava TaxID=3048013 RepID=A0ABT7CF35_9BACT|nr:D-TA family PLP-dependent enzyme [Xanthocytophaga flavus]MDJ1492358.1 D-TA family PLP-dependent enzyme [Xanthocytophaga flavus]
MSNEPWYVIKDIDKLDSPALVVYPDRVKHNITVLKDFVSDTNRLRPHVKTHKSIEVTQLLLEAGIHKFKCATIAEAEMLAIAGAKDILLAYQPTEPKMHRLIHLIQQYPTIHFSCLVDNVESARMISNVADISELQVSVFIDVNIGMNRTGILPDQDAFNLYEILAGLSGTTPLGFHAYDGHIRETDLEIRKQLCAEALKPVLDICDQLEIKGYEKPVIIAGGSPTFPVHAANERVECSPGTFVYWDKGYQSSFPEQPFLTAALVVTRVVSLPSPSRICVDLGHKSIAAENELTRRVYFVNAPDLKPVGQSEEHLVLEAGEGHFYQVGDILYGLPYHVCPTCALYEKAYTIENGIQTDIWKTIARDRSIHY